MANRTLLAETRESRTFLIHDIADLIRAEMDALEVEDISGDSSLTVTVFHRPLQVRYHITLTLAD